MSTRRKGSTPRFAAEHGEIYCREHKLCVECGEAVTGRRRRWCSDECVEAYMIRSDPKTARWHVHQRDLGICARCGLDTERVQAEVKKATRSAVVEWKADHRRRYPKVSVKWVRFRPRGWNPPTLKEICQRAREDVLEQYGMAKWWWRKTWWDSDHVHAVADGGGECTLDNLRTLCIRCHSDRSSRQQRRRPRKIPREPGESAGDYRRRVIGRFAVPQGGQGG